MRTTREVVVAAHDSSQTLPERITISKPVQDSNDMFDGKYQGYPVKLQRVSTNEPRVNETIDIHRWCQHENVLMVLTVESTECYHFRVLERFHLTLEKYLKKHRYIDVDIRKAIIKGLDYLHNKSIVHGNLTTSNVLLRRSNDPRYIAKLGDLGSSKRKRNKGDIRSDLFDLAVTLLRCVSFNPNQDWQDLKIGFYHEADKLRTTNPEAYHLIMKLVRESNLKISEVLLDPFFWKWMMRMDFMVDVSEVLEEKKSGEPSIYNVFEGLGIVVFDQNECFWFLVV